MRSEKAARPARKREMIRAVFRGDASYTFVRAVYEPAGYFGWRQPAWQLVVLLQGSVKIVIEGKSVFLQVGEGILMHPGWEVLYLFDGQRRSVHTGCQVDAALFTTAELRTLKKTHGVHRVPAAVHVLMSEGLSSPLTAGAPLHAALGVMAKACLLRFAAAVGESSPAGLPPHPAWTRALALMEDDPTRFATAAALARSSGVSVSRLRQVFKAAGDESPSAMLWRIKTAHAVQMIRSTGLTLGEIAAQSGFANAFHLSRSVKKRTGQSPRGLRQTEGAAGGKSAPRPAASHSSRSRPKHAASSDWSHL